MIDKGRDLTRLVDKLVKLSYLERNLCKHNRRQMEISITKAGMDILKTIQEELDEFFTTYNLTEEEALTLSNLLDKLRS